MDARGMRVGAGDGGRGGAGVGGMGGGGGVSGDPSFGQPACPSTVVKGGACAPTDSQFCYKTCGPESVGVKSEMCTTARVTAVRPTTLPASGVKDRDRKNASNSREIKQVAT